MAQCSPSAWEKANDEARAHEQRERDVHYLPTTAAMRHRDSGIRFENMGLLGGVPVGRLRFSSDVDSIHFYETLHEL